MLAVLHLIKKSANRITVYREPPEEILGGKWPSIEPCQHFKQRGVPKGPAYMMERLSVGPFFQIGTGEFGRLSMWR